MKHTLNLTVLVSGCLLACAFPALSQVTVEWDKVFGGDSFDILTDAIPTADGGYLLVGYSTSGATYDKSESRCRFS